MIGLRVAIVFICAAMLGSLPARAQYLNSFPLTAGFWVFPAEKIVDDDELDTLCSSGFSLYFTDQSSASFLPSEAAGEEARWINDYRSRCEYDGNAQTASCTNENWSGTEFVTGTSVLKFSVSPEGQLSALSVDEATGAEVTTWPRQCPSAPIMRALGEAMAPG